MVARMKTFENGNVELTVDINTDFQTIEFRTYEFDVETLEVIDYIETALSIQQAKELREYLNEYLEKYNDNI